MGPDSPTNHRISTRVRSGTDGFSDPWWTSRAGIGATGGERFGPNRAEAGAL